MNNKVALLLMAAVMLTACAESTVGTAGCSTQHLNFILKPLAGKVAPEQPKCVVPGTTVSVKITLAGGLELAPGDVMMKPKLNNPDWLSGDNSAKVEELEFTVPADTADNKYYNYLVEVKGHYDIDPIVKVVGQQMYMKVFDSDAKEFDKSELDAIKK